MGRTVKGRFAPGVSGNPSGRPRVDIGFRERCREFVTAEGWDILLEMARTPGRDQRPALELLAAYGFGKPTQAVEHSGGVADTSALDGFTVDEMRAWLQVRRNQKAAAAEGPLEAAGNRRERQKP